jgi:peptidoglycan/LPS O-acetylase OafA/YrhL
MMSRAASAGQSAAPRSSTTTELPAQDRPFFTRVESLRGLGAMAIAAYHISGLPLNGVPLFPTNPWEGAGMFQNAFRWLAHALFPPHAALMVFFIISGFVLRLSLTHGPQQVRTAAPKFLLGRLFRIYPVVIFGVVVTALLPACRAFAHGDATQQLTLPLVVRNALLLDVSMNYSLWALQLELLMVPVIFSLYFLERNRGPGILAALALITTALAFSTRWALWPALSANLFAFLLGMLIPTFGRRFALGLSRRAAMSTTLAAILGLIIPRLCFGLYTRFSAVIEAYAAVVLVSLTAYRSEIALLKCLDARPLRLLGCASGSYYVLHMLTVPFMFALASALIPAGWSAASPALVGFLALVCWLVTLGPLALCSYYLVEAPGIALGQRVIRFCRLSAQPLPNPREMIVARRLAG